VILCDSDVGDEEEEDEEEEGIMIQILCRLHYLSVGKLVQIRG